MKNNLKSSLATWASVLLLGAAVTSCKQELNEVQPDANKNAARVAATIELGNCGEDVQITESTTWTNDNEYIIRGYIRVLAGAVLTIEAGTVIKGDCDGTLIIERGAQIQAEGTAAQPVLFTSINNLDVPASGDWGGIVILGRASNNQAPNVRIEGVERVGDPPTAETLGFFGPGTSKDDESFDTESSGTLRYVRIEYAGRELTPNNEINSLTLGGVGSGTVLDHISVIYARDDAFEFFGGTVNAKYLYAFATQDDDFDTDLGHRGNIQFALAVRDRSRADISGSNGIETDNNVLANANELPRTSTTFSNVTVLLSNPNPVAPAFFENGILLRRGSAAGVYNSAVAGFPFGYALRDPDVTPCERLGSITVFVPGIANSVGDFCGSESFPLPFPDSKEIGFGSSFRVGIPDGGNPVLFEGTDFSQLDASFFEPTSFRGASDEFGSNWDFNSAWLPDLFQ